MRRVLAMAILTFTIGCSSLTRTNFMLKDYVGKSVDTFMSERAFAAELVTPMKDGGSVYQFAGGPGGRHCRFFVVTDANGTINSYRFENC